MKTSNTNRPFRLTELLIYIVGTELAGALSALVSGGELKGYYMTLEMPPFSPPPWVFPAAWGILYALMALGAYLISLNSHKLRRTALTLYLIQLAVNLAYAPVFFGLRSLEGGLLLSILLAVLVTMMTVTFLRVRRSAAAAVIPYLLWTYYAVYLSVGILSMAS